MTCSQNRRWKTPRRRLCPRDSDTERSPPPRASHRLVNSFFSHAPALGIVGITLWKPPDSVQMIRHQSSRLDVERPLPPACNGDLSQQGATERRGQDGRTIRTDQREEVHPARDIGTAPVGHGGRSPVAFGPRSGPYPGCSERSQPPSRRPISATMRLACSYCPSLSQRQRWARRR